MNYDLSKLGSKERSFLATLLQLSHDIRTKYDYSIAGAITLALKDSEHTIMVYERKQFSSCTSIQVKWNNDESCILFWINDDNWDKIVKKFKLKRSNYETTNETC